MAAASTLFGGPANAKSTDVGLLVLRVFTAFALAAWHGLGKIPPSDGFVGMVGRMGFPAPELFAWMAAFAEVGGALLIALGLLTRPTALLLVGHFAVVVLLASAGDPFKERELPLFYFVVALTLLFSGAGRYSVDAALRGRRDRDRI